MPICKRCLADKPCSEFYRGVTTYCADCWKAIAKEKRAADPEKFRARDKARAMRPDRVALRAAYAATERGKEVSRAAKRKWAANNVEKRAAHIILGNAVKYGRVAKPSECQRCGQSTESRKLHAHHDDYALPLEVEWICSACHAREHRP